MFQRHRTSTLGLVIAAGLVFAGSALSADAQEEWKKVIEAAKKEGKVVAGGPPTGVLRQKFKETLKRNSASSWS